MTRFSKILKQQEDTRAIANQIGEQLKMQITIDSIKEDMARLSKLLPTIRYMNSAEKSETIQEVQKFYAIVERITRSKNGLNHEKQQELESIFKNLRDIKNSLFSGNFTPPSSNETQQ